MKIDKTRALLTMLYQELMKDTGTYYKNMDGTCANNEMVELLLTDPERYETILGKLTTMLDKELEAAFHEVVR